MFGLSTIIAICSIVLDDCPTLTTVGAPTTQILQHTNTEEIDEAIGACVVPSKLWELPFENSSHEFMGTVQSSPEHNPACPHLSWPYPLDGANYSEVVDYNVYSAAVSVPAAYAYKLTRAVTSTAGSKQYPINNSSALIFRVGVHLDEVNLIPIIYPYVTVGGVGSSGGSG